MEDKANQSAINILKRKKRNGNFCEVKQVLYHQLLLHLHTNQLFCVISVWLYSLPPLP